jgi:adenosine deaminase
VAARGIPLEMCLTSNVHTHAVAGIDDHPARRYFELGIPVTLNTDSRLMDRTTLTNEYWVAHTALGFSAPDLVRVARNTFVHAFLPDDERRRLLAGVAAELDGAA